tara:strand:- start:20418 stop:20972 length:555 start_codon:yes stop_codon:yes gene_type:complete
MMANQGLYNAFLAAGLIWTFFIGNEFWKFNTTLFFLACISIAGIIGALTVSKKIFIIQGIPALVTIGLLLLINNPKSPSTLPDPLAAGWKGESVCEVVQEDAKIRVLRCTFPPGVGHEEHEHAPHFGYTVKGSTFEVKDKYSTRKVKVLTGSHFYKPVTSVHEIQNIGDSTAVFLIIEQKNTYQ